MSVITGPNFLPRFPYALRTTVHEFIKKDSSRDASGSLVSHIGSKTGNEIRKTKCRNDQSIEETD